MVRNGPDVATALCPECGKRIWLLEAARYGPGAEPEILDGPDPVKFPHCGKIQSVPAKGIRYTRCNVMNLACRPAAP
jgi:hypothetical protein